MHLRDVKIHRGIPILTPRRGARCSSAWNQQVTRPSDDLFAHDREDVVLTGRHPTDQAKPPDISHASTRGRMSALIEER